MVPRAADRADPERYSDSLATEEEIQMAEGKGFNVSPELAHTKKKVGSFADDLTADVRMEYETIEKIKDSLIDFGSGLCINVEKTTIMRIGNREPMLDPRIPALGFTFVDGMKVLGFEIDFEAENLGVNFDSSYGPY
jgi:hypothetical protein